MNQHRNKQYQMDFKKVSHLLVSILFILIVVANSDDSQDVQECSNSLIGLSTCLPYVGGTAKSPTPDCCNGLKQVLNTNKKCLCVIIKDRNDPNLGLNINVTLALTLPDVCKATANISQCPALLKLPPNSPEAQVFYQLNSTTASAPGPAAQSTPSPITSPTGANATGSMTQHTNAGSAIGNRCLVPQILGGAFLMFVHFIM